MIEEKEDFFEQTPEEKPKKVKPPKQPKIRRDDPRFYDREEDRWEHITPSPYRRGPLIWVAGAVVALFVVLAWLYTYLFSPQVSDAVEYGYVDHIQREGKMFPTYEGVILPYKMIKDTTRSYTGDFIFSTKDEHVAAELRRNQSSGQPVKVEYKVYSHRFPWRGNSATIVTAVQTVSPDSILPKEYRPARP